MRRTPLILSFASAVLLGASSLAMAGDSALREKGYGGPQYRHGAAPAHGGGYRVAPRYGQPAHAPGYRRDYRHDGRYDNRHDNRRHDRRGYRHEPRYGHGYGGRRDHYGYGPRYRHPPRHHGRYHGYPAYPPGVVLRPPVPYGPYGPYGPHGRGGVSLHFKF